MIPGDNNVSMDSVEIVMRYQSPIIILLLEAFFFFCETCLVQFPCTIIASEESNSPKLSIVGEFSRIHPNDGSCVSPQKYDIHHEYSSSITPFKPDID